MTPVAVGRRDGIVDGKVCETEEERKILGESSLVITRGEGPEAESHPPWGGTGSWAQPTGGGVPEAGHSRQEGTGWSRFLKVELTGCGNRFNEKGKKGRRR